MKPDEILALSTARSVDFEYVAGNASNVHGVAARRRLSKEEREAANGRPLTDTVKGAESMVIKPRYLTKAEVGHILSGCRRMPLLAAMYSWAGDMSGYDELHRGLTAATLKIRNRSKWPRRIRLANGADDYYVERLTELALDADGCAPAFAVDPGLYAKYMGITQRSWDKPVLGMFLEVKAKYEGWLDEARANSRGKLRHEDLTAELKRNRVPAEA